MVSGHYVILSDAQVDSSGISISFDNKVRHQHVRRDAILEGDVSVNDDFKVKMTIDGCSFQLVAHRGAVNVGFVSLFGLVWVDCILDFFGGPINREEKRQHQYGTFCLPPLEVKVITHTHCQRR